jgi:hypothetical protein
MKPLLLFLFFLLPERASAQSLDYISVRKSNGRVIKNFYSGSTILLQLSTGRYVEGPLALVRNDSVYVTVYDIRFYRTNWGSVMQDTLSANNVGLPYREISRVFLNRKRSFFERSAGPLLKIGGAGYFALNLVNGNLFDPSLTDSKNLQKIGFSAGAFGLGILLSKLFATDGFSKAGENIVYVNLSH